MPKYSRPLSLAGRACWCVCWRGRPLSFRHPRGLPDLGRARVSLPGHFAVAVCACANAAGVLQLQGPQPHQTLPALDPRCVRRAEKHLTWSLFLFFFYFSLLFSLFLNFLPCAGEMQAGEAGEPAPAPTPGARKSARASSSLCSQPASAAFYFIRKCHALTQSWMLWRWVFHTFSWSQPAVPMPKVWGWCSVCLQAPSVELLSDLGQSMPASPHMSSVVVGKQPQAWPPVLDKVLAPSKVLIILEDRCPALLLGGKLHHLAGSKSKTTEFQQQVQGCSTDQLHQLAFLCALCTPKLHFKILLG